MKAEADALAASTVARAAVWQDADPSSQTLARAFFDDPLICFLLRDEATRSVRMPRLFRLLFKLALPHGACDVTSGYEAVALWRPPGQWHIPLHQYIRNGRAIPGIFGFGGGFRPLRVMAYIEARHPAEPHFYLQAIGTDPVHQGKGYGGLVMRRQLAAANRQGMPAYLESSKEKNIPFYQSFGFEVTGEIRVPNGGPTLYPMWRKAQGQS